MTSDTPAVEGQFNASELMGWTEHMLMQQSTARLQALRAVEAECESPRQQLIDARESVAALMIRNSFATGHGDTLQDLLGEFDAQLEDRRQQLAAAKLNEAHADLLREAADDCEDCANTLLNDASCMGPTKEAKYRKEAVSTVARALALRAWADAIDRARG